MSEIKRPVSSWENVGSNEETLGRVVDADGYIVGQECMLEVVACINLAPQLAESLRQAVYSESESMEMEAEIRVAELLLAEWDKEISRGK